MKSTVVIYDSHLAALDAISTLRNNSYPIDQLSIIGKTKIDDVYNQKKSKDLSKKVGISIGIALGSALGILSAVGVFDIPDFGFLFGAGMVRDLLAGFTIGFAGGGIASILIKLGIKYEKISKYSEHLNKGKFLVIAQGNDNEIEIVKNILGVHGKHIELCIT